MKRLLFILALALTFVVGTATAGIPADPRSPEQIAADNTTLANTVDNMSDRQKLELLTAAQNVRAGLPAGGTTAAAKATEWVGVGSAIGDGLVATAGKLGVEVNKFATSPVGKMAMLLIVWNYMGEEVSGWVCGTIWLLIMGTIWWKAAKRTFGVYNEKGKFIRFDRDMLNDKAQYGMVYTTLLVTGGLIALVGVVFLA